MNSKTKNYVYIAGMTLAIFTVTYTGLLLVGFVPKEFEGTQSIFQVVPKENGQTDISTTPIVNTDSNLVPQKVEIPKIGVSSIIQTPTNIDVATLDTALSKGAVYYPGSGTLKTGNLFLFGHSTNWKVVNNQAYKTFNDLDKLVAGDKIILTSNAKKYTYIVQNVRRAADDDVLVEFNKGDRMLTISTCDTFGQKQDRWVVEAEFEEV